MISVVPAFSEFGSSALHLPTSLLIRFLHENLSSTCKRENGREERVNRVTILKAGVDVVSLKTSHR